MGNTESNLKLLVEKGFDVSNIELTKVGDSYFCNIYSEIHSSIITSTVYTGFARTPQEALAKALSEAVERKAFEVGYQTGIPIFNTSRSDGFAAMPRNFGNSDLVLKEARNNAMNEATERYLWATWWDQKTKAHIEEFTISEFSKQSNSLTCDLLHELQNFCEFNAVLKIEPLFSLKNTEIAIFFVPLSGGGFISGGACDKDTSIASGRAFAELYRHGLAWSKSKKNNLKPSTFYEQRLVYFASGEGDQIVNDTLNRSASSEKEIILPPLKFDEEVRHDFSDLYICYRCLYHDQPSFGDGELKRLCL